MCTETLAKIVLIIINIAFFLGGGAVLVVGIIAYVKEDLLYSFTETLTTSLGETFSDLAVLTEIDLAGLIKSNAIILIVVGAFLFVLGFMGCCGAMRKSSCLLMIYAILVLVILAAEVGLGVYAYMYSDKLETNLQDGLKLALTKTYANGARISGSTVTISNDASEIAWDAVQFETQCCGVSDYNDWDEALKWNKTYTISGTSITAKLPPSCCKRTDEGAAKTDFTTLSLETDFVNIQGCMASATAGSYNEVACYDRVREIIFDNKNIVIAVFVVIVAVEVLGISCACWLKQKSDKKD